MAPEMRTFAASAALAALLACGSAAAARYDFGTVIDNLDRRKVTKVHAQDYCKQAKGAEVSWSGKVYDVKGGRRSAKIYVANGTRPIYRGYNIVAVTSDLDAAAKAGLRIARVPAYSPHAVAEHTLGMMLALNRKYHKAFNRVREGNFSLEGLLGFDMHGKTAGVVGTGKIGAIVAQLLACFGCELLFS